MKKLIKIGLISSFLMVGAFVTFSSHAEANVAAGETASSPRSLYVSNCARCHGSNGKSQTALGKKLDADDISGGTSASKTVRVVTNGKGSMPSFKKRLTAAQIAQIADYVHGL